MKTHILLGQLLLSAGLITEQDLQEALARQRTTGERLGEALVAQGRIGREELLQALARQVGAAYLGRDEFPSALPYVKGLSPKFMRQYRFCPMAIENGTLTLACADPCDPLLLDDLRHRLGYQLKVAVAPEDVILDAIERAYGAGPSSAMQRIVERIGEDETGGEGGEDLDQLRDMAFEAPVVRLVNLLIENSVQADASDIHIEPFEDSLRVRYRIDGILFDIESPPRRLQAALTSRIKIMAELNIAERRLPQDGRIRMNVQGKRFDIRVSTVPTIYGESIVMRLLDRSSIFLGLDRLGFGPRAQEAVDRLIRRPHGMFLVTGPTGSGKTTTLYAALDKINSPELKIITIEDPVEYQLKGVNQIAVKPKIGMTFANGLRHIVRQDPDVIMVGEIRDLETAEIAVHAALTGHMVFSTLHTNDAPGAITRLLDMGVESYLVASVLEGVLAQRLVRRICQQCKAPYQADPKSLRALGIAEALDHARPLFHGQGCEACRGTGYRGRTGIYELLMMTEEIRGMILRKQPTGDIRRRALELGMATLRMDGWTKAIEGITTVDEILRVTQDEDGGVG
jgi:general secretion pathway protein E